MNHNHFTHHITTVKLRVFTPVNRIVARVTDMHPLDANQYKRENGGDRGGGLPWRLR